MSRRDRSAGETEAPAREKPEREKRRRERIAVERNPLLRENRTVNRLLNRPREITDTQTERRTQFDFALKIIDNS